MGSKMLHAFNLITVFRFPSAVTMRLKQSNSTTGTPCSRFTFLRGVCFAAALKGGLRNTLKSSWNSQREKQTMLSTQSEVISYLFYTSSSNHDSAKTDSTLTRRAQPPAISSKKNGDTLVINCLRCADVYDVNVTKEIVILLQHKSARHSTWSYWSSKSWAALYDMAYNVTSEHAQDRRNINILRACDRRWNLENRRGRRENVPKTVNAPSTADNTSTTTAMPRTKHFPVMHIRSSLLSISVPAMASTNGFSATYVASAPFFKVVWRKHITNHNAS